MAIERDFNLHAANKVTLLEALGFAVLHINDRFQATAIHLAVGPLIERQGAAQHFGVVHHRQETAAKVAQHAPVETILGRGITGKRWRTEVTYGDAG